MPNPANDQPVVLYVDDEPLNRRVFEVNFKPKFNLIICSSGMGALEVLGRRDLDIGVVVADQRMPDMTGVGLIEQVREISPDTVRLIITAYSDVQAAVDAVNRGQVARYFVKPWQRAELSHALDDGLRIYTLAAKLRDIQVRMLQSERLATLGQVSASIAHELMNPMAYVTQNLKSLSSALSVIERYVAPALAERPDEEVSAVVEDLPALLKDVGEGVRHIEQVALRVRSQARGVDAERSCDLADVAHFVVKLAGSGFRQRARIAVYGNSMKVALSPVSLTQVLLNLVVNAGQAVAEGKMGLIELQWGEHDGKVRIVVRDNGCGIPKELHEKVFEPLFTTKPVGVGTGLGLAICRDVVRAAGGEIGLGSEVGVGTTVEITLPRG